MIVFEKMTGWHVQSVNQKYTSIFADDLKNSGDIRFLGGVPGKDLLLPYLVDISKKGLALVVSYYPHNDTSIIPDRNTEEFALMDRTMNRVYDTLVEKYEGKRTSFTIDLFNMAEITMDDFKRYSQGVEADKSGICAFIFDTEKEDVRFPRIFILENRKTDEYKAMWPLLGAASRHLALPVGKRTTDGKYLSFLLLNANHHDKFIGFAPTLAAVEFPTSVSNKISAFYNMTLFEKLLDNPVIDSLRVKSGRVVDERPDDTIVPGYVVDEEATPVELDRIIREMVDKNSVSLSDVLLIGADEILKLNVKSPKPLNVNIDVGGYAAKMCIFEGYYYAVPAPGDDSLNNLNADFGDKLVECEAENFPSIFK